MEPAPTSRAVPASEYGEADPALAPLPNSRLERGLQRMHALALERFPSEASTLDAFFLQVRRELHRADPAKARIGVLRQFEDYLDALLLGQANGTRR